MQRLLKLSCYVHYMKYHEYLRTLEKGKRAAS